MTMPADRYGSLCAIGSNHGQVVVTLLDANDTATPMATNVAARPMLNAATIAIPSAN